MENDWSLIKLENLAEVQNGCAFKANDFGSDGIPVIKIKNIQPPNISFEDAQYFGGEINNRLKQFLICKKDILISMTGSHVSQISSAVGKVGRYGFNTPALLNQRVGKIYSKNELKLNNDYLYYLISRPEVQLELATNAGGSANQANISPQQIKNLEFEIPDIKTQSRIGSILSSLDDKIELNRRMNQTLEQMAQALFNHYFVDNIDLGNLPEGWEISSLDKIADYLNGIALQKYRPKNDLEFLPVIKIKELKNGLSPSTEKADVNIPEIYIINDGDVLFSWSGSLEVDLWCNGKGALNQHLFKVSSGKYPKWFYYIWTKEHLQSFKNTAASKATTMGHIQRHHLTEAEVILPPKNYLEERGKSIGPLIDLIISNRLENNNLSKTRDTLLPKLMSGEIDVGALMKEETLLQEETN